MQRVAPAGSGGPVWPRICSTRSTLTLQSSPRPGAGSTSNRAPAPTGTPRRRAPSAAPGPSAAAWSNGRWAPVNTTGRGSSWARPARKATSSMVSVPWVTTTPSGPLGPSDHAASRWRSSASRSDHCQAKLPTVAASTTSRAHPSGTAASRSSSAPVAVARWPPSVRRLEIVPPVATSRIRVMSPLRHSTGVPRRGAMNDDKCPDRPHPATTGRCLTSPTAPWAGHQLWPSPRSSSGGREGQRRFRSPAHRAHSADASTGSGATAMASISISHSGWANDVTSAMVSAG